MRRSRFSKEQIIGILREHEPGATTAEVCRRHRISDATFYKWKANYGGWKCRMQSASGGVLSQSDRQQQWTELTSAPVLSWATDLTGWHYIEHVKPVQNALIESFNSKLREECLTKHVFVSMAEPREIIEAWRHDYNHRRPHSSLRALTPREFADQQGDDPPEQVWGSAARPLAPPPHQGQNINPLYLKVRLSWGAAQLPRPPMEPRKPKSVNAW